MHVRSRRNYNILNIGNLVNAIGQTVYNNIALDEDITSIRVHTREPIFPYIIPRIHPRSV